MKELERTKRISISAILFLLVIAIAILTFKKPKHIFHKNSEATLQEIVSNNYILSFNEFNSKDTEQFVLIDIRSNFEYNKGHFENAANIPIHQILADDNIAFFNESKNSNKTVLLYGKNPDEANSAWMVLYQLGYENVKIISIETSYLNNKFQIKNHPIEKPAINYAETMNKAQKTNVVTKTNSTITKKSTPKSTSPKKVIAVKKKKKRVPEGGC